MLEQLVHTVQEMVHGIRVGIVRRIETHCELRIDRVETLVLTSDFSYNFKLCAFSLQLFSIYKYKYTSPYLSLLFSAALSLSFR
jgi:hypothetical protein